MMDIGGLCLMKSLAIIALVGENMKSRSGVSAKLFGGLGNNGVNVRAIAQGSSEKNISVVISEKDVKKAVNVLHEEFFESEIKQVHLYICGVGSEFGGNCVATYTWN
jgi:aspartokinase/homoserine dehydrogenase 1